MIQCNQTENMSILQHGQSVWHYTQKILNCKYTHFKLPDWFIDNYDFIVKNLYDKEIIKMYNIYHDCGKPFCITYDEDGRRHFPNHAEVSKETFTSLSDEIADKEIIANLIGYDMALHVDTAETIKSYNWNIQTAFTLLVTAFAEIHSNADMFGGIDSLSFKMKYKKLDQRGKMLLQIFKT